MLFILCGVKPGGRRANSMSKGCGDGVKKGHEEVFFIGRKEHDEAGTRDGLIECSGKAKEEGGG
jgi:hypothetical protein